MQLHSISNFTHPSRNVWLYSAVHAGKISAYAVLILLISFLIQPIHKAIASELSPVEEQNPTNAIPPDKPISDSDLIEEEILESDENDVADQIDSEESIETDTESESSYDVASSSVQEESQQTSGEDLSEVIVQSDEDTGVSSSSTENNTVDSNLSPKDEISKDPIDQKAVEKGVNDLVGNVVNEVVMLARQMVTEENFYQFSRQSCVAVGDGTFHCTTNERSTIDQDTAVFADRGANGNMEIFMRNTKGESVQLTDNSYDDTSPDLDATSMRVVWQRMIDGRYQIISYDLRESKETQLTFSRTNSMEPKVSKDGVVWQEWDGSDWEIMFFDGTFMNQITDNEVQDVTPTIEDDYILWSVLGGLTPEAKVYSIENEQTMTITGHDGGAVANPRFVLVYDTKFDNGDIVTQGFDPITGLAAPISAKPAERPFDIPEPDPVGEIRALINNKSTQKGTEVITIPVSDDGRDLNLNSSTTSSTSTETLILPDGEYEDGLTLDTEEDGDDLVLTEYDLVITESSSSTNSALNKKYNLGTTTAISTQE